MQPAKPEPLGGESQFIKAALGLLFFTIWLSACTAHYPVNDPISSAKLLEPYSLQKSTATERSDELLLLLTFSGGGTRAAALSYGVLEALADTHIVIDGKRRRLLDEVDAISSVSGGSFTAAYYGLFGDRIFKDYETRFLKRDVQSELTDRVLSPSMWSKMTSAHYGRSDLAAEYYDEILFERKTFQDILASQGPIIAINAADIALGSQFTFIASQFAPICADLRSYPIARAVTASSAVPGAFTTIVLKNYAGTCDYQLSDWATEALGERRVNTRRYQHAKLLSAYLDVEKYPYIHLLDGGISDNLGIRLLVNMTFTEGDIWNKLKALNLEATSKLAVVVVNARKMDTSFALNDTPAPLGDILSAVSSMQIDQYSLETLEILRNNMSRWRDSISSGRCREKTKVQTGTELGVPSATSDCTAQTYLIEVNFEVIGDQAERKHLENLPTSFYLEPDDVDRLRAAGRKILSESPDFQKLVADLQ